MKILLTGGTGFIGAALLKQLTSYQIELITRDIESAQNKLRHTDHGNIHYYTNLKHRTHLNDIDIIINLAGEPIASGRWTNIKKQKIAQSRWQITQTIVDLMMASKQPPETFISGSAVGYYGHQIAHFGEMQSPQSDSFTHQVCQQWEAIAQQVNTITRVCIVRTGIVLGQQGGALQKMQPAYKLGLGSPFGSGQQFVPWIHLQDMVNGIVFLMETPQAQGSFNFCAPHPVTNKQFSQALAKTLHRPHLLRTPEWIVRIIMGESACLLFDSIPAKPQKLTEMGFQFNYSRLELALKQIIQNN